MNIQTKLSTFYNQYILENNPKQINKRINLNDFLLKKYFKDTLEVFIGIEIKEDSFNIYKKEDRTVNYVLKTRLDSNEDLKDTILFNSILEHISEKIKIEPKKAYDIAINKVNDYTFQLAFRFSKKSPFSFSEHKKKKEVYEIIAREYTHSIISYFMIENISEEKSVINFVSNVEFYINKIKNDIQKTDNKKEIEYLKILQKAYSNIIKEIKKKYPAFFETHFEKPSKKIIWSANPHVFFMIFSILIEEKILKITNLGDDRTEISKILYDFIEVNSKKDTNKPYSQSSFMQYLKSTGNLQKKTEYNLLKSKILELLKK